MRITEQYDLHITRSGEPITYVCMYMHKLNEFYCWLLYIRTYIHTYTHVSFKHSDTV